MTRGSLRFRLFVAALVAVAAALLIAGASLMVLFGRHAERRIGAELESYISQIIAGVDATTDGRITFGRKLADPRFEQPQSGLYWQLQDEERPTLLRSRSLWDAVIALPPDARIPGAVYAYTLPGPAGQELLVRERRIMFGDGTPGRRVRVAAAIDRQNLIDARNAFAADMLPYLAVVGVVLLAAAWLGVRLGLAPLDEVRRGVKLIRSGKQRRLVGVYPEEVMPLVNEVNGLLEAQEQAVSRARSWTADLAHGLKTPLTVLTADAQRLRAQGDVTIAADLEELADAMRRRVDRELIRARVRTGIDRGEARADVGEVVRGVVRTLQRTPRGAAVDWAVESPASACAAIVPDDLSELVGNLCENAARWADKAVAISVSAAEDVAIAIEDDGPGVPGDQRDRLGLRGVRLDEHRRGSGLGLAIVRDIVDAYRGTLSFGRSARGGLAVTVRLPRAG